MAPPWAWPGGRQKAALANLRMSAVAYAPLLRYATLGVITVAFCFFLLLGCVAVVCCTAASKKWHSRHGGHRELPPPCPPAAANKALLTFPRARRLTYLSSTLTLTFFIITQIGCIQMSLRRELQTPATCRPMRKSGVRGGMSSISAPVVKVLGDSISPTPFTLRSAQWTVA